LVAIFAVAIEDGMTIAELARNYGFSHQLASRYAMEARGKGAAARLTASRSALAFSCCRHPWCPPGPPVFCAFSDVDRFSHRSGGNEEW
jgi:hypothetical protein